MSALAFIGMETCPGTHWKWPARRKPGIWQAGKNASGIEAPGLQALRPALVELQAGGGCEFEAACALQALEMSGQRSIRGARSDVRCAPYMAKRVALRRNPVLQVSFARLLATGKRKKAALLAAMRANCSRH